MMRCTWVLSFLLLILPACLHNPQARILKSCQKSDDKSVDCRLKALSLEAKYSDIPVPLGSEPLYDFFKQTPANAACVVFGYTNKTGAAELYNYFKAEFIRLGWNFMGGMQDIEAMLTFEKPDRVCSINLRPLADTQAFIMMVYPKDDVSALECT